MFPIEYFEYKAWHPGWLLNPEEQKRTKTKYGKSFFAYATGKNAFKHKHWVVYKNPIYKEVL